MLGPFKDDACVVAASRRLRRPWAALRAALLGFCFRECEGERSLRCFESNPFIIETLRAVAPVIREIGRHDADLARQARRAASNIALNAAEAYGSSGGIERMRFRSALGSAHEVRACLDVAEAFGYVDAVDARLRDAFDRIAATLYRRAA